MPEVGTYFCLAAGIAFSAGAEYGRVKMRFNDRKGPELLETMVCGRRRQVEQQIFGLSSTHEVTQISLAVVSEVGRLNSVGDAVPGRSPCGTSMECSVDDGLSKSLKV